MPRYSPDRVAQARKNAHKTQAELGEAIGRTFYTVTKYERGVLVPSAHTLGAIATACGVSVSDLFDPDDPNDLVTKYADELKAVVAGFPPLDEHQRSQVRALLRGIAS
jgi:transcriptional regulator with XRE-family HTH domain